MARTGTERQRAYQLLDWPGDDGVEAGEVFVLVDPSVEPGEGLDAAALVAGAGPGEGELRRLALTEGSAGGLTGRRLVEEVANVLRARGVRLLHASPTDPGGPLPALLIELGFRHRGPHRRLTLDL